MWADGREFLYAGRRLIRDGGSVLAVKLVAAGISLGLAVAVTRTFGADDAGLFFLARTVTTIGATLATLGLSVAVLRFVSVRAGADDWPGVAAVYRQSNAAAAAVSTLVALGLIAAAPWITVAVFSDPDLEPVLRIMALAVPAATLLAIHAGALRGLRRPVSADVIAIVTVPLAAVVYLVVAGDGGGLSGLATVYVAASYAALGAAVVWWRRSAPRPSGPGSSDIRQLLTTAGPLLVVTSMALVTTWTDIVMVGIFETSGDVAVYTVAARTAGALTITLTAANAVLSPRFALLHSEGRIAEIGTTAQRAASMLLAVTVPVALVLVLLRGPVLRLFGTGYDTGATVLVILTAAQIVNLGAGSVGPILSMTGNQKAFQYVAMVAGAANIVLNAVFIPPFGIEGAAVATATTLVGMNIGAVWLIRRRLGVAAVPLVRAPDDGPYE